MLNYIVKRLTMMIPILFGISFIAFLLINLAPSDPAEVALRLNEIMPTPDAIESMRQELGLNKPFFERYFTWLYDVLHLEFGRSFIHRDRLVWDEVIRSLIPTLVLAMSSFLFTLIVSLVLGVLCAIFANSAFDHIVRIIIFLGTAMPSYWLGLLFIWLFATYLDLLPTNGYGTWQNLILPTLTLSFVYISTYIRFIRNNMLENMHNYSIFYARSRGLKERTIILKHVLVNSLHTTITALGMTIPQLIAGSFVVEYIFSWPGLGRLCIAAIMNRDYPVIQAYILIMAILFVVCNFIVDVIHQWLDPRLRSNGGSV
ncbi:MULTISPECIES: nickel/cobalt ABC transporter permease [unclassified Gilliamella]|uniref:nickel/cobalt ABC transporter permease n=1 Tax=unclassified Gilliamella TaxID=2685620 RepID=UPI002269F4EE|nr:MULTISPECIES: nickel/cobalt ABC transporter permease [unclassified Gilliamella]MCX8596405.1 ABC transporter permease subunit [Gilliamella sp. B3493]MCX8599203.1 ABC transporter permease subunit [Gilliamella sp. B3486]MCX8689489.1 ABC transporter permease subunit [Gilliamella sp. B2973]MCX8705190.1 ABC transporter permease subunit [Gilliamella sp. B3127]